jgi:hypothetical protein
MFKLNFKSLNAVVPIVPSTPLSSIVAGRFDFQVRVCIIHLWTVPADRNRPTEIGSIQMLLLDEKVSKFKFCLNI